jgi:hypothetical protein
MEVDVEDGDAPVLDGKDIGGVEPVPGSRSGLLAAGCMTAVRPFSDGWTLQSTTREAVGSSNHCTCSWTAVSRRMWALARGGAVPTIV